MLLLKLKDKIQWLDTYAGHFVCNYFHEISHWVAALFFYCIGLTNNFPKITIATKPEVQRDDERNCYRIWESNMYVNVEYTGNKPITLLIITLMPAVTTVLLFWFSPWYLWLYYLGNIGTLWLSVKDTKDVYFHIEEIKRIYFTKQLQNENNNSNPKPTNQDQLVP